jgi:hypothetical protein
LRSSPSLLPAQVPASATPRLKLRASSSIFLLCGYAELSPSSADGNVSGELRSRRVYNVPIWDACGIEPPQHQLSSGGAAFSPARGPIALEQPRATVAKAADSRLFNFIEHCIRNYTGYRAGPVPYLSNQRSQSGKGLHSTCVCRLKSRS